MKPPPSHDFFHTSRRRYISIKRTPPVKSPLTVSDFHRWGCARQKGSRQKQGGVPEEPGVGMPPLHFLIAHGRAINYFLRRRRGEFISHSLKGVIPRADNKFLVLSVTTHKVILNNCLGKIFEMFFFYNLQILF